MLPNLRSGIAQLNRKPKWIGSGRNMCTFPNNNYETERPGLRVLEWMIRRGSVAFAGYMLSWIIFGAIASRYERQGQKFLEEQEESLKERERRGLLFDKNAFK